MFSFASFKILILKLINFNSFFLFSFLLLLILYLVPKSFQVLADNEFSSTYNISYEVDSEGTTTVTEKITLKNLTDQYYASNFSLNISATQISDVAASDNHGPLEVSQKKDGGQTNINVNFKEQIAGKDKTYNFMLMYKSKDFAQKQGKIWQVTIPKITSPNSLDNYQISLIVPVAFGDPTLILPEPIKQTEVDNKLNLAFSKEQLLTSGIFANFGANQFFKFDLGYNLENDGLLPKVKEIALPSDTPNQQVILFSVNPQPDNSYLDADSNTIFQYRIQRGQKVKVLVQGLAKLSIKPQYRDSLNSKQIELYTGQQKYWEKDSPQLAGKVTEIFLNKNPKSNTDKAKLIDAYVVSNLTYNQERIKNNDFARLGALTILGNPNQALCQEFSDLFVTLSRSANIPTRQLIGYSFSNNQVLRPLSLFSGQILHSWVEFFDPLEGWVMADPTWENTTGGIDYFGRFDLNHLVLVKRGVSSTTPQVPAYVKVDFYDGDFTKVSKVNLQLLVPSSLFAGLSSQLKVRVENFGNVITDSAFLKISSNDLELGGITPTSFYTPKLPPAGFLEYNFDLKAKSPFDSKVGNVNLWWADQKITKQVVIQPFFTHQFFAPIVSILVILMILTYPGTIFIHIKKGQKNSFQGFKKGKFGV